MRRRDGGRARVCTPGRGPVSPAPRLWSLERRLGLARPQQRGRVSPGGSAAQELLAAFSLLGELEDEDDEEDEKLTPPRPGGLVAVFCPVRLLRQTGQLSCCREEAGRGQARLGAWGPGGQGPAVLTCSSQGTMQPSWKRWLHGSCRTLSPSA